MRNKVIGCLIVLLFPAFVFAASAFAGPMLAWDPPATGEVTGYRLYYGTTSGSYSERIDVGANTTYAISDLSLADSTTYFFAVRAFNSGGEGPASNEVSWTSGDNTPPLPPQGIVVE